MNEVLQPGVEELVVAGGKVVIQPTNNKTYQVSIVADDPQAALPRQTVITSYPRELIVDIAKVKGLHVCDEISREIDPAYVEADIRFGILGYLDKEQLSEKSILDFGCGSGSSTCILSRLFPDAKIIGLDISEESLHLARTRAAHYGLTNVNFIHSANSSSLPEQLPAVDVVSMTGVYEHLLEHERVPIMSALWSALRPGGYFFLHQTPHRFYPIETHTTGGLLFVNWLPRSLAHLYVLNFSRVPLKGESWQSLLRKGLRGGTRRRIIAELDGDRSGINILQTRNFRARDTIDLWYMSADKDKRGRGKNLAFNVSRVLKRVTRIEMPPYLTLGLQKSEGVFVGAANCKTKSASISYNEADCVRQGEAEGFGQRVVP